MGVALYAFPTESWRSLLALSTPVRGVFTGGGRLPLPRLTPGAGRYTGSVKN